MESRAGPGPMGRSGIKTDELARDRLGAHLVRFSAELEGRLPKDEILSIQPDLGLRLLQLDCDPRPT